MDDSVFHGMKREQLLHFLKTKLLLCNLKNNWFFPVSAAAFFCLHLFPVYVDHYIGILIALAASIAVAASHPSILNYIKQQKTSMKVLSMMTAMGVCWAGQIVFIKRWSLFTFVQQLEQKFFSLNIPLLLGSFGAFIAVYFIFFWLLVFWNEMKRLLSNVKVFQGITLIEKVVFCVLLLIILISMLVVFSKTEAFYGTLCEYDVIYTSDSPTIVGGNAYLALNHGENDLRQPLFALFAAPFVGAVYLIGKLFRVTEITMAMLVNTVQIIMLFSANYMLTKMMKLNSVNRICFMILFSCTYMHLLFVLMMEQYIVAYFWLIFCIYLISQKEENSRLAVWGAGGTLLTSMILLPFISEKNPIKEWKAWLCDMVKCGVELIAVMLTFFRFDVFYNLKYQLSNVGGFTGETIHFSQKLYQFTGFVHNCFFAPKAGVNMNIGDHISWQLHPATNVNWVGVGILLLVLISFIWNWEKTSARIAGGWVAFSLLMLLFFGWGTKENGLILYSLYFGWAYLVLLYHLIEKIEEKSHLKNISTITAILAGILFMTANCPGLMDLLQFAIEYYPI